MILNMKKNDLVRLLRSSKKIYLDVNMSQSHFSQMLIKIENNLCKPKTTEVFFNKFGYYTDGILWTKK